MGVRVRSPIRGRRRVHQPRNRGPVQADARNAALLVLGPLSPASAREVMTDRCSAEVAIVPSYDALPQTPGAIIIKRGPNGSTDWTPPFTVRLGSSGHIRWWCHSTSGNVFDPGTWRIDNVEIGTKCEVNADFSQQSCRPDGNIKLGSSAWNGWTPERSRCNDRSVKIRARLGPNRLLQIECLFRIFKNMRTRMAADGLIADGLAPSYYIEGLLYNAPNEQFGGIYTDTFCNCVNWLAKADKSKLVCASSGVQSTRSTIG